MAHAWYHPAWFENYVQPALTGLQNFVSTNKDILTDIGAGVGGGLLTAAAYNRLLDVGSGAKTEAETLAKELLPMTQFRPFTVTSATGGKFNVTPPTVDPVTGQIISGGTGVKLELSPQEKIIQSRLLSSGLQDISQGVTGVPASESAGLRLMGAGRTMFEQDPYGLAEQQAAAAQAFGLGGQFMGQAGMSMAGREADVYNRIRATQLPEEERQRLALEERLAQQGRLGVRTSMFGGTPEQLAMEQAQAEAQNRAALAAISQAQAEQAQQAALGAQYAGLGSGLSAQQQALGAAQQAQALQSLMAGQGMLSGALGLEQARQQLGLGAISGAYLPQAQLLNVQQATQLYPQLQQQAQLYGTGTYGETMMSALEAQLIAEQKAADLMGAAGTGLLGSIL